MNIFNEIKTVIISADIKVFKFINVTLHNEVLAWCMKFAANDFFLIIFLFAAFLIVLKNDTVKKRISVAFSLWALIAANIVSSKILKVIFKRQRPVVDLENIFFLVKMKKYGYAFPSTHTAMAMALAVVLWSDYKNVRIYMALFVFCVGFFCVYTGGHYPLDVMGGAAVGWIVGMLFNLLKKYVQRRTKNVSFER